VYELLKRLFHIGNFRFSVLFLKQLLLRNCAVDFVKICNIYAGRMIIKAANRIFNSDKICRSYSDLNFGVTFLEHSVFHYTYSVFSSRPTFVCRNCRCICVSLPERSFLIDR